MGGNFHRTSVNGFRTHHINYVLPCDQDPRDKLRYDGYLRNFDDLDSHIKSLATHCTHGVHVYDDNCVCDKYKNKFDHFIVDSGYYDGVIENTLLRAGNRSTYLVAHLYDRSMVGTCWNGEAIFNIEDDNIVFTVNGNPYPYVHKPLIIGGKQLWKGDLDDGVS